MPQSTTVLLSLGSNLGDRKLNLTAGLERLIQIGLSIRQVSPTVESPAQLPAQALSAWNRPFLNLIVIGETTKDYESFLSDTKAIQARIGKPIANKWAPRELDIDIVAWGPEPHLQPGSQSVRSIYRRPYVLSPLVHTAPDWQIAPGDSRSALQFSSCDEVDFHIPLWMGIINLTPDSFSDAGRYKTLDEVDTEVRHMILSGVNIIDVGAESTRPNATPLSDDQEWQRLEPALERIKEIRAATPLGPAISVDTYHPQTAKRALESGVDIINDVSGLRNQAMQDLAKDSGKTFIAMHSVTVPVDPKVSIDQRDDPGALIDQWIDEGRRMWEVKGLDLNRIIVDPGIGFGKSRLQSLELLRSVARLRKCGFRVLIGHSRKRFLKSFSDFDRADLDIETIGASLNLCAQSVDILRVHNVGAHTRAYLGWTHLLGNKDDDQSE